MATLGEQAVGSIVKLNVGGVATDFIVVHQGLPGTMYDSSCNGTWLLMKTAYESRAWHSSQKNDYGNSDIHSYLNSTFVNLFDADIDSAIKQVILPYTKGTGKGGSISTGSSGISAKVFLLSYTEVGFSGYTNANEEGAVLNYFNGATDSERIAYIGSSKGKWYLRSPCKNNTTRVWYVNTSGSSSNYYPTDSYGIRPALILPSETAVSSDGMVGDSGAIIGTVNINGVQRELTGEGYINIGGVLRDLSDAQTNIGGILKSLKG